MRNIGILLPLLSLVIICCDTSKPNQVKNGQDELQSLEIHRDLDVEKLKSKDLIYVPIYSDIYADEQNQSLLLAATLSIRNTHMTDSLFIDQIKYYNTQGDMVRDFINEETIGIPPMATVNYVIEKEDNSGGAGANFIVSIYGEQKNMKPIIQAVMVHYSGNKGFAFTTNGFSIL